MNRTADDELRSDDQPRTDEELRVDTGRAHPARVHDYWLGGKDNFAADREVGDAMMAHVPAVATMVRANRRFLGRAVRYMVRELGITQFLDLGSGIPAPGCTHETAQEIVPQARVVYVDNDPVVAAHSRALLTSSPQGSATFLQADVADPTALLRSPEVTRELDLDRPVGLMLISILLFFDDEVAAHVVRTLLDGLAPGSHVAISHITADFTPAESAEAEAIAQQAKLGYRTRTRDEFAAFFDDLVPVPPGIVPILAWRPEGPEVSEQAARAVHFWGGVAHRS